MVSVVLYLYSPEIVAIHFNARGIPDSWASRNYNLMLWVAFYSLMTGFFLAIPLILQKTPVRFINMPNKYYWLAPERRYQTILLVSNLTYWMGSGLNAFFIALGFLSFRANSLEEVRLDNAAVYILLGMYLVYSIVWLIRFYSQFRRPS